jgi:dCMP deaminase
LWFDRSKKYKAVVHAEVRALLSIGLGARGATMYVTHHPCRACAPIIASAGIKKVVCPAGPWRDDPEIVASVADAAEIFQLCGVEVTHVE